MRKLLLGLLLIAGNTFSQDTIALNGTIIDCDACDGKVWVDTVSIAGAVLPFTYQWENVVGGVIMIGDTLFNACDAPYRCRFIDDLGTDWGFVQYTLWDLTMDTGVVTADVLSGSAPLTVAFTNTTPNIDDYDFEWLFDGGGYDPQNDSVVVHHTYTTPGTFYAQILFENAYGCSSSAPFITIDVVGYTSLTAEQIIEMELELLKTIDLLGREIEPASFKGIYLELYQGGHSIKRYK